MSDSTKEESQPQVGTDALLAFGSKVLADLLQGEWEPDWEWQQEMIELATKHGLMTTRPADQEDDPEEYDIMWVRLAPVVPFPANTPANPRAASDSAQGSEQ